MGFIIRQILLTAPILNIRILPVAGRSKEFTVTDEVQPEIITSTCTLLTVTERPDASYMKTTYIAMRLAS